MEKNRIVAVSNRLPINISKGPEGIEIKSGSGGLVTALAPVIKNRGGLWIGWSGGTEDPELVPLIESASKDAGFDLHPVPLTEQEIQEYYYGFSNEIIWPLFHDLQTRCNFKPEYWYQFLHVNKKFAQVTAEFTNENDFLWVHDYHLFSLASFLKEMGKKRRTAFFLHIPFPPLDIFLKLPWRDKLLRALLDYDLVGFQTMRDRKHFVQCVQALMPKIKTSGKGSVVSIYLGEKRIKAGAFPISIDFSSFEKDAASKNVADCAWYIHEKLPDQKIILGVDRLDYTKGILERLEAMRLALLRFPELRGMITLILVVVPSREDVSEYKKLKTEIERLVGEINGQFTISGWVPIHYLYRSLEKNELLSYYRLAEIALVTPLKDGMNLVAKEYCACNIEENGVLVLSEFAGAAAQLHPWALMVNPYDVEGVAEAIHRAFFMDADERASRMKKLRNAIRKKNIFWWVNHFLEVALEKTPS